MSHRQQLCQIDSAPKMIVPNSVPFSAANISCAPRKSAPHSKSASFCIPHSNSVKIYVTQTASHAPLLPQTALYAPLCYTDCFPCPYLSQVATHVVVVVIPPPHILFHMPAPLLNCSLCPLPSTVDSKELLVQLPVSFQH